MRKVVIHVSYAKYLYTPTPEGSDHPTLDAFHVNNAGCSYGPSTVCRPKGRRDFQLIYLQEGTLTVNESVILVAGDAVIYHPGEPQYYTLEEKGSSMFWVHFTGHSCNQYLQRLLLTESFYHVGKNPFLLDLFKQMYRLYTAKNEITEFRLNALTLSALSEISVNINYPMSNPYLRICRKIESQLGSKLSVRELAEECQLSPSQFTRNFTKFCSCSPKQYQMRIRLEKAKDLLAHTDDPIDEIAVKSGFYDSLYLSKYFREQIGISPSKYRRYYR